MNSLDYASAEDYPWLAPARTQIQSAVARERLPHAVLIHAARGLGAESLALWIAAFALCEVRTHAPCRRCGACRLLTAGTHPDLTWVTRADDAKQLQIDQIRSVCDVLALKSYRGGYKVAVIATADVMNANAANALLKTLEEPPPQSLLILCSARPSRLPATVVSRCHRLTIATPPRELALEWLRARDSAADWKRILAFACRAPLRALELHSGSFADLDRDMTQAVAQLASGELDIPAAAERWAKDALETRLEWIETWITDSVRSQLLERAGLQTNGGIRKIRDLYGVLDCVRGLKLELTSPLNMQLAAEDLLLRTGAALAR